MEKALNIAFQAAKEGGKILLEYFNKIHIEESREKNRNDFVSLADFKSEERIKDILTSFDPEIDFLGEEGGGNIQKELYWVVDPLDGTKNFLHGFPFFSISIALLERGEPVIGIIYEPVRGDMFYALRGKGAYLNGERLKITPQKEKRLSLIATGFPFKKKEKLSPYLEVFKEVFLSFSGIRRAGSAALDLAYTAKNTFSGFFEFGLSIWDIAAGSLMVKEAGGIVRDSKGGEEYLKTGNIIAGEQGVVETLLEIIKQKWSD